jgi:GMP synthase-like glutamine amidotransferase
MITVFEHSPSTGALRLGAALRDYGHRLHFVHLYKGEPVPDDLDDVDGVVTAGGRQSPLDDEPWIDGELAYLRRAHDADLPIVGICLGHQLLARALGGEAGPLAAGLELGWQDVTLTPAGCEDPLHAGLPWTGLQFHWHRFEVTTLPEGARVLAKSDKCAVQAWALGLRTYGFQYHPEVYPETIETWSAEDPGAFDEAGISADMLRSQTKELYRPFARLRDRLFESMALRLFPADRRVAGLVKDLHH